MSLIKYKLTKVFEKYKNVYLYKNKKVCFLRDKIFDNNKIK